MAGRLPAIAGRVRMRWGAGGAAPDTRLAGGLRRGPSADGARAARRTQLAVRRRPGRRPDRVRAGQLPGRNGFGHLRMNSDGTGITQRLRRLRGPAFARRKPHPLHPYRGCRVAAGQSASAPDQRGDRTSTWTPSWIASWTFHMVYEPSRRSRSDGPTHCAQRSEASEAVGPVPVNGSVGVLDLVPRSPDSTAVLRGTVPHASGDPRRLQTRETHTRTLGAASHPTIMSPSQEGEHGMTHR